MSQYDFDKFPLLKQTSSVLNFELALEFCEIDHMKKMGIFFIIIIIFFYAIPFTQLTRKSNSTETFQFSNYSTYRLSVK